MQQKLLLALVVAVIIPIFISGAVIYRDFSGVLSEGFLETEIHEIEERAAEVELALSGFQEDILYTSQLSSLSNYVSDIVNNRDTSKHEKDLISDFFEFSKVSQTYYQVRYLDQSGREIVRVNFDDTGVTVVPKNELQDKKERYYFEETMQLEVGEVYISSLDLNIEHGEIEIRSTDDGDNFVPVIRYATPIDDENGDPAGIIITNAYAENFLDKVKEKRSDVQIGNIALINADGYYLAHTDKSKEWGFIYNNNETIFSDCSNISRETFANVGGQIIDSEEGCNITFKRIDLATRTGQTEQERDHFFVVISEVEDLHIFGAFIPVMIRVFSTLMAIALFSIVAGLFIGYSVIRSIRKLRIAVDQMGAGNFSNRIEVKTDDDLGKLAEAFNVMATSVHEAHVDLEKKVEERTKKIQKTNRFMVDRELRMGELKDEIKTLKERLSKKNSQ
jgi:methyl-accepting chemotaxis protein